jgi:hypothetical protein
MRATKKFVLNRLIQVEKLSTVEFKVVKKELIREIQTSLDFFQDR